MKIAAVQAAYVLMDREAAWPSAVDLLARQPPRAPGSWCSPRCSSRARRSGSTHGRSGTATGSGTRCSSTRPWSFPARSPTPLGAAAREAGVYLVIGVEEREPHGTTIYNTILYFGPDGALLGKHRKLMPTGSERTVWGMGDGSTLPVVDTPLGRIGGLICWENYMPLARFHLYAQGVDMWTGADAGPGRRLDRDHAAHRPGGPLLRRRGQPVPARRPDPGRLPRPRPGLRTSSPTAEWVEPGNSVIVGPNGDVLAGPARHEETILTAELDSTASVRRAGCSTRRALQPARHLPADGRHQAPPSGRYRDDVGAPTLPGWCRRTWRWASPSRPTPAWPAWWYAPELRGRCG